VGFRDIQLIADNAVRDHLGGVVASYRPQFGGAVSVTGMLDEQFSVETPGAEMGVEENTTAFWCDVASLPEHPDDDEPELTIQGSDLNPTRERPVVFTVRRRIYDGVGQVALLLHEKDCG
jgi:hypothetical protein